MPIHATHSKYLSSGSASVARNQTSYMKLAIGLMITPTEWPQLGIDSKPFYGSLWSLAVIPWKFTRMAGFRPPSLPWERGGVGAFPHFPAVYANGRVFGPPDGSGMVAGGLR